MTDGALQPQCAPHSENMTRQASRFSLRGISRAIFDFRIDAFSRFRKIVDPQRQQ